MLAGSIKTIPKLETLGFAQHCFAGAVTSGEITFGCLQKRPDEWWQGLGKKCIHISWGDRGAVPVEGMGIEVNRDTSAAKAFLLLFKLGYRDKGPCSRLSCMLQSNVYSMIQYIFAMQHFVIGLQSHAGCHWAPYPTFTSQHSQRPL